MVFGRIKKWWDRRRVPIRWVEELSDELEQAGFELMFTGTVGISSNKMVIVLRPSSVQDNYLIAVKGLLNLVRGKQETTELVSWVKVDDKIEGVV